MRKVEVDDETLALVDGAAARFHAERRDVVKRGMDVLDAREAARGDVGARDDAETPRDTPE